MATRRIDGVGRWWLMERRADVVALAEVADLGFTRQAASRRHSLDRLGTAQGETRRDETEQANHAMHSFIQSTTIQPMLFAFFYSTLLKPLSPLLIIHHTYSCTDSYTDTYAPSANTSPSSTLPTLQISFSSSTSSLDSPRPPAPPSASLRSRAWPASRSATRLK
jgi:hypothetical protein